eukprot:snap_masked-scaffold_6-processed-gene-0.44-mRNA-1 protein AED:0.08 eAED:0.08 QI:0/-1/0/1/-1/1/1/0/157
MFNAISRAARSQSSLLRSQNVRVLSSVPNPGYIKRQESLNRPVSPHVTIYAFPLAAISSIAHRVSGGLLAVGLYGTAFASLMTINVPELYMAIGNTAALGSLTKFTVASAFALHFGVGIRHFFWEFYPENLNSQTQYQTAAAIFGFTGVAGLAAVMI